MLEWIERVDSGIVGDKGVKLGYFMEKDCELLENFKF